MSNPCQHCIASWHAPQAYCKSVTVIYFFMVTTLKQMYEIRYAYRNGVDNASWNGQYIKYFS